MSHLSYGQANWVGNPKGSADFRISGNEVTLQVVNLSGRGRMGLIEISLACVCATTGI